MWKPNDFPYLGTASVLPPDDSALGAVPPCRRGDEPGMRDEHPLALHESASATHIGIRY